MATSANLWFPQRWQPEYPDRIQLYSMATPNGQKISIGLEEMQLPYEAHLINIMEDDQKDPDYLQINPNGKIPSLSDPDGPDGQVLLMESGAILEYLACKTGRLLGNSEQEKLAVKQWVHFQIGHVGPMFGQFGHFYKYARDKCDHPYPVERYTKETQRLLSVLEKQLQEHAYIAGEEYSIADIAIWPWVDGLERFYAAGETLELPEFPAVKRWHSVLLDRPAVDRGRQVCSPPD